MFHAFDAVTNTKGDSLVGYQVALRQPGTGALVSIYADDAGTPVQVVSGIPDIAVTDNAGNYSLFVPFGTYDVEIRSPDAVPLRTIRNVPMNGGAKGDKGDQGEGLADVMEPAGSELVGFQQAGPGSVPRTVQDKARERISAFDFGVVGDGVADDTAAINAALAYAKARKIAVVEFLWARCRVTGPLVSDGVGMVWAVQGFGPGDPGLYPEGSGYTVIRLTGFIPDLCMGIFSSAQPTLNASNVITADARPNLLGAQLSNSQDQGVLALSRIRWLRVVGLRRGVLIKGMWDTSVDKLSIEYCGGSGADDYALDVQDGGFTGQTTNENVISYAQVEHAVHRAIRISPNLLSCRIGKIHSERAFAVPGVQTWNFMGGGCIYDTLRLNASVNGNASAPKGTAVMGGSGGQFRATLVEDASIYYSVLAGGSVTFEQTTGVVYPLAGQNGRAIFRGGTIDARDIDGYATFDGTNLTSLSCGFAAAGTRTVAINCEIGVVLNSSTQAALDCIGGTVRLQPTQTFRALRFFSGCEVLPSTGNALSFAYQYVMLDASSRITANVTVDFCGFDWRGTIVGTVNFTTTLRTVVGADAKATGAVTGYAPPAGSDFIGTLANAQRTKNPAWVAGGIPGWLYATSGASWHPEPVVA